MRLLTFYVWFCVASRFPSGLLASGFRVLGLGWVLVAGAVRFWRFYGLVFLFSFYVYLFFGPLNVEMLHGDLAKNVCHISKISDWSGYVGTHFAHKDGRYTALDKQET